MLSRLRLVSSLAWKWPDVSCENVDVREPKDGHLGNACEKSALGSVSG